MDFEELKKSLRDVLGQMGVGEGDILYVSSDMKTFLFNLAVKKNMIKKAERDKALGELVDTFQEIIAENGTLMFPVFSWEWCRGKGFDYKRTKGEVGTLSNWILENRLDFVRTKHPIYSFLVWGKDAEYLKQMDNQDAWSHASPFYYLQTRGAKQLLFNVEAYQGFTFGHYLEQEAAVPYRHPKYFFGEYVDENGVKEKRVYSMYVRDVDVESGCGIHNSWLIEKGIAERKEWEGNSLTVVDLEKSYPIIYDDMLNNNGKNTLDFTVGTLNWDKEQTVPYEIKML